MIQCDICLCWQHGICLGVEDEEKVSIFWIKSVVYLFGDDAEFFYFPSRSLRSIFVKRVGIHEEGELLPSKESFC